ncbi:hypothetical protein [Gordonia hankookensis]|uniref:Uncharacterized protein n=1 Tax=Gordonia hankookensis TaxID=589403 RepID=A0ABR7WCQ1_9ACTN|nr:hypothetical protein [Gordonia hankookensis]MBD1320576.1 hypothetical protein [Gordonia hankookensis]
MSPVVAWPTYKGQWTSDLLDVVTDSDAAVEPDREKYRLNLEQLGWRTVTFTLNVSPTEPAPAGIDARHGYALITCRGTNTRIPFRLIPDVSNPDQLSGLITLNRDVLEGSATLSTEITAQVDGRTRVVARAIPWTIVLREFDAPTKAGEPPISQVWVDFNAADAPAVARKNTRALAALDAAPDKPVLYLNAGVPGLQMILTAENAKLERRRLRDILGSQIARYTVSTLFRLAAAEVVADGDEDPIGPSDPLLRSTCEKVAGAIPHFTSVDELYAALARSTSRTDLADLWADIDAAIDALTDASSTASSATSEVQYV